MRSRAGFLVALLCVLSGCGSGSSTGLTPTTQVCRGATACDMAQRIASQTRYYELAGATHTEAACHADVTGRVNPIGSGTSHQFATLDEQQAIDRCAIPAKTLSRIGDYVRRHPPK